MRELALFAGAGGGILGGILLGWRTVCAVEIDAYCRSVLLARQRDGMLPRFPIWDDVRTFDGRPWRGQVDVISGGFPCQDISSAGMRQGIKGPRSGLWAEYARVIGEIRPRYAVVENSPDLVARGLGNVLGDLASLGYNANWDCIPALAVGANHRRYRMFVLAHASSEGLERQNRRDVLRHDAAGSNWWGPEPSMDRVAHGVAHRVDRTKAIGNGQVPAVVRLAWETLGGDQC